MYSTKGKRLEVKLFKMSLRIQMMMVSFLNNNQTRHCMSSLRISKIQPSDKKIQTKEFPSKILLNW